MFTFKNNQIMITSHIITLTCEMALNERLNMTGLIFPPQNLSIIIKLACLLKYSYNRIRAKTKFFWMSKVANLLNLQETARNLFEGLF